jgi:hypothetical protein
VFPIHAPYHTHCAILTRLAVIDKVFETAVVVDGHLKIAGGSDGDEQSRKRGNS